MLPLQQLDISQYEFEEFCEKYAFNFYERVKGSHWVGNYDKIWKDFYKIKPSKEVKYDYITSLKTRVIFTYNLDNYVNPGDNFYTMKLEQND